MGLCIELIALFACATAMAEEGSLPVAPANKASESAKHAPAPVNKSKSEPSTSASPVKNEEHSTAPRVTSPNATTRPVMMPHDANRDLEQQRSEVDDRQGDEGRIGWELWVSLLNGAFAALLLIVTAIGLRHAKRSAESAAQSADAARDAAQAQADALRTQRAWMIAEGTPVQFARNILSQEKTIQVVQGDGLVVRVDWRNCGATPAIGTKCSIKTAYVDIDVDDPPSFDHGIGQDVAGATVGQGRSMSSALQVVVGPDFSNLMSRKKKLIVYSAVTYYDVFEPEKVRISEMTSQVMRNGEIGNAKGEVVPYFMVMMSGPQQTTI